MVRFTENPQQCKASPHSPEPVDALRARLGAALAQDFDMTTGGAAEVFNSQARMRDHIFDFEDGTRLGLSFDRIEEAGPFVLHASISATPGSRLLQETADLPITLSLAKISICVKRKIEDLFQANFPLGRLVISAGGYPHFFGPDKATVLAAMAATTGKGQQATGNNSQR